MDDIRQQSVMNGFFSASLRESDPEVATAIEHELIRQQDQIEMIASENIVSVAVMEAQGSVFTNKYAEGYSGRRYYDTLKRTNNISDTGQRRTNRGRIRQ